MTRDEMLALAERVEGSEGADRELDAAIFQAIGEPLPEEFAGMRLALTKTEAAASYFMDIGEMRVRYEPPAYTASLDAAMTLVPEGWEYCLMNQNGYPEATLTNSSIKRTAWAHGSNIALAITTCALRARSAQLGQEGEG